MTSNNKLPPTTAGISAENVQNPCVFNVFPFFKNAIWICFEKLFHDKHQSESMIFKICDNDEIIVI